MNNLMNENVFIQSGSLAIRSLAPGDEDLLLKWLTNDHVLKYYEGRDRPYTLNRIKDDYFDRNDVVGCIVSYDKAPIGYIQFYRSYSIAWVSLPDGTYGMDQFIGEPSYWNKGIGTELVKMVVEFLVKEKEAALIVMDPQVWNDRAIACYEKVGFKKKSILKQHEWHEGAMRDCQLMMYEPYLHLNSVQDQDRSYINDIFKKSWGSDMMVVSSGVYHSNDLDGFYLKHEGKVEGLITYVFRGETCEIISLDSFNEGAGIGSKLLLEVELAAYRKGIHKVELLTTNDNMDALRFYQKRGYRITSVFRGAVDEARKVKKEIPKTGYYNIPLHDELLLTKNLK
ncbi:GNAT family N-acetyltransferase [Alkalihalobacillus sp. CinArs1]|uniref:GNAT family N-acetyltransferase n=1 Tax=Alkalihalobacillus sp. CinArs1 TaxID=2995314 RepID=UPI0022DE440C|nr:GNAT family N-acetyltransferase [Alkalihalobacillus sp. CinArs1]